MSRVRRGSPPPGRDFEGGEMTDSGPLKLDDDAQCDDCGRFGAFDLTDRHLCEVCYRGCGSCCPECGGHDLWADDE